MNFFSFNRFDKIYAKYGKSWIISSFNFENAPIWKKGLQSLSSKATIAIQMTIFFLFSLWNLCLNPPWTFESRTRLNITDKTMFMIAQVLRERIAIVAILYSSCTSFNFCKLKWLGHFLFSHLFTSLARNIILLWNLKLVFTVFEWILFCILYINMLCGVSHSSQHKYVLLYFVNDNNNNNHDIESVIFTWW